MSSPTSPATLSAPRLTVPALSAALIADRKLTAADLISLLGTRRADADIEFLETALIARSVLGERELAERAAALTGLPPLTDPAVTVRPDLPEPVAAANRALVLNVEPRTVALVTDDPARARAVEAALDGPVAAWVVMTETQFARLHSDTYLDPDAASRPLPADLYELLDQAVLGNGSDVHLTVGRAPAVRIRGSIQFLPYRRLESDWLLAQVAEIAGPEKMAEYEEYRSTDFAYSFGDRRFRVNVARDRLGPTLVARLLPKDIPDMEGLGLSESIRSFTHLERGLVLVTGPTGSGKSTTLASILAQIARTQARHITTFEDPIEFLLPTEGDGLVTQRELGKDIVSFGHALRAGLRQDPDIILLGEMRDRETIAAALEAAETGHLVFGTLHTMSADKTVSRIVSTFPAEEQSHVRSVLSGVLQGVVSQTLLPTADGKGRVAAHEVLLRTPATASLIRTDGDIKQAIATGSRHGMRHMEAALADLVRAGRVTLEEAEFRAPDKEEFTRQVSRAG